MDSIQQLYYTASEIPLTKWEKSMQLTPQRKFFLLTGTMGSRTLRRSIFFSSFFFFSVADLWE